MPRLTEPTPQEALHTWTGTHPAFGGALSLDQYIQRESRQADLPLARDGGLAQWILTDAGEADSSPSALATTNTTTTTTTTNGRSVLSSCETLRKRALVRSPDGRVAETIAHGVASVFTDPGLRGKGYASAMMNGLGDALRDRESRSSSSSSSSNPTPFLFSILYSDVGKDFYDRAGWRPFASAHLEFPAITTTNTKGAAAAAAAVDLAPAGAGTVSVIRDSDIPPLAQADEQLIRRQLLSKPPPGNKTHVVALLPDAETLQWHHLRDAFHCQCIFSRTPTDHGVVYTTPQSGRRIWVIWRRRHSGTRSEPEKNTLYILRFVIEDEDDVVSDEELAQALEVILTAARREAAAWACGAVHMWNPDPRVQRLAQGNPKLEAKLVDRETSSIASLKWFGNGTVDDVEWVANEKFAWC